MVESKVAEVLKDSKHVIDDAMEAVGQTKRVYGARLLMRGLLWVAFYVVARGLLETAIAPQSLRIAIALLPVPFFVWWLWTWMKGVGQMDELERRIELEALAFAFPIAVVLLMTLGLLDLATPLNPDDWSLRHVWAMMPALYFMGLWRAKRRYQ